MTTAPEEWRLGTRPLPPFEMRAGRVVVVSAHPDDETLGAGGLILALGRAGADVTVVVATDGEAAFPDLDREARARLAGRRRREMGDALRRLGLDGCAAVWLGLADSALDRAALADALRPHLEQADLCLAPWPNDPHPDHAAAGLAARDAAGPATEVWCYPIWTWVWEQPAVTALPWDTAARHRLSAADSRAKQQAIAAFDSQVRAGPGGRPPVVDAAALAHFSQGVEVLFRMPAPVTTPLERFESLYRACPDPWATSSSGYERRKRRITLDSLPRDRYRRALDAGCGTGTLTAELAGRCSEVVAFDGAAGAVAAAGEATRGLGNVSVSRRRLPGPLPAGPFDLVVFSEILYYLGADDLAATLDATESVAPPGADLVAVDWRPVTPDAPRDADAAHRQLLARPGWETLVEHREARFLLHVLRRR